MVLLRHQVCLGSLRAHRILGVLVTGRFILVRLGVPLHILMSRGVCCAGPRCVAGPR